MTNLLQKALVLPHHSWKNKGFLGHIYYIIHLVLRGDQVGIKRLILCFLEMVLLLYVDALLDFFYSDCSSSHSHTMDAYQNLIIADKNTTKQREKVGRNQAISAHLKTLCDYSHSLQISLT